MRALKMKPNIVSDLKSEIIGIFKDKMTFSILYGGACYQKEPTDLDILIVLENEPSKKEIYLAKKMIINISRKYNLPLDDEVKYEKKLVISKDRLRKIFNLSAFHNKGRNKLIVPLITSKKYLNSNKFLDRLFLNTLTSPNIFICGIRKQYNLYSEMSFKSLKKLIFSLNCNSIVNKSLIKILFAPRGIYFKNYLGYKDILIVKRKLLKGLKKCK